jgi:hypothetical protein
MERAAPPTVLWHHLPTLQGGQGGVLELYGHVPHAVAPTDAGWRILATDQPLPTVLNVQALAASLLAPLLVDLAIAQQRHPSTPVLLIRTDDHLARRLIASSRVRAVITTSCAMATVPVPTAQPQAWVGVKRPTADEPALAAPLDVALLAALEQARTIQQAAQWIGVSRSHVKRRLRVLPVGVRDPRHRSSPSQWATRIRAGLAEEL